ncbi:MAG: hypothetical protein PHO20_03690 [Candidatus Peribacteraceae bacterium]|nr:hypothetical protein [Candidatus Peribacteraceae bacterium]MDD5739843.1 hypothetical protein [Candidatus Peribacteraceae bacterium]
MTDDITNGVLLEHIQGMRNDLQQQISALQQQISALAAEVHQGFKEAQEHRQALQEDLEETMRVQSKHAAKLVRV